ncbi:MAG: RNA polymerase sigma factor [Chryseolinea sp.]
MTTLINKWSKRSDDANEVSMQDDHFLERAIRGERTALVYLVKKYKDLAYTVAIKVVANREDAEEVVQDAFMKAFASLREFRRASKFSTWLYRIVYNTALTKISRRKLVTVDIDGQNETDVCVSRTDQQFDLLEHAERKKYIHLALGKLSRDDYLVISLHYIGEKSIAEICQILDMKKSAVKMRLLRGRKQLQAELEALLSLEIRNLL